jgi:hypothetical protein
LSIPVEPVDSVEPVEPHGVRVIVERVDRPRGSTAVGDFFDVVGSKLMLPPGGSFDVYAFNAAVPVLGMALGPLPEDDWLARKPYICGPDPVENVVMKLVRMPVSELDATRNDLNRSER